jgi:hypothetical protein
VAGFEAMNMIRKGQMHCVGIRCISLWQYANSNWIHVKQISILSGILTMWSGCIILVAIGQISNAEAAFLAG